MTWPLQLTSVLVYEELLRLTPRSLLCSSVIQGRIKIFLYLESVPVPRPLLKDSLDWEPLTVTPPAFAALSSMCSINVEE